MWHDQHRPQLATSWYGRRENADTTRRAELRKVLESRVAALEKEAFAEIERRSLAIQTALLTGGLESEEARRFLATMPTAEALMPGLSVREFPEVAALVGAINAGETPG